MSKIKKKHLLIVGGTGYIGYHLALFAKKKSWKVSSISLNDPKPYRHVSGVKYFKINISKLSEIKKKLKGNFTYVVNLGGYVNHSLSRNQKKEILNTHLIGLINLTKFFSKKKIKKFVQIGSSVEYGNITGPQSELNYCEPMSYYGTSKLAATQFLQMLYSTQDFPVIILRFFQVYGPSQDQNRFLPQIINGCLNNKKFATSAGNQVRDFCYISDVVDSIILCLLSKKINGNIFNIGSGKPVKIKNIIKKVCKIIGGGKPQFGKIKYRKDENMKLYSNIKKAKSKLKWKPKVDFEKGIKITINSFKI